MTPKWLSDITDGSRYQTDVRKPWLSEINARLIERGIKITEEKGKPQRPLADHPEVEYPDYSLAVWEKVGWLNWTRVATIVAGEKYPRVKDGTLPDALKLKPISLVDNVPSWYEDILISLLVCDDEIVMAIFGAELTAFTPNGRYTYFELSYSVFRDKGLY